MIEVLMHGLKGVPPNDVVLGAIRFDGKIEYEATSEVADRLLKRIVSSSIMDQGGLISPDKEPEKWIGGLFKEYKSAYLRADKAVQRVAASKLEQYAKNKNYWFRALTKYEKRVDFKAIQGIFDEDALTVDGQIRAELRKTRDSLLKKIEEADNGARLTPEFISGLKLDTNQEVARALSDYLVGVWRDGRDLAFNELPGMIKAKVEPVKQFEKMYAFCPTGEGGGVDNSCSPSGEFKKELEPVKKEIQQIQSELGSLPKGLFKEARIVGSWAKQQPDKMPDRKGPGTSDLDIILVAADDPPGASWQIRTKLRDARSAFIDKTLKGLQSASSRKIELRVSDVVGTDKTIRIFATQMKQFELMYAFCPTGEGGGIDPTCSPQEGGGTAGGEDFNIIDMKLKPLKAKWPPKTNFGDYLVLELKNGDRIQGWIDDDKDGDFLKSKSGKIVRVKKEDIIAGIKLSRSRPDYSVKRGYQTGLEPIDALNYFRTRALILAGIIDDDLLKQAKFELLEHIKGGRPLIETIGNLRSVFEPWVGDPTKIGPSGQVGIGFPPGTMAPENILMAFRLENVIRTETTTAMSQGRVAIGDAAGDYVIGYELSAILDSRTTIICQTADGLKFRKEDPAAVKLLPALHYQCRTIPVFVTSDDLPVEWSSQAEIDKVVRLISPDFK